MLNTTDIIADYYRPGSKAHDLLVMHGRQVAQKALAVAAKLAHEQPDMAFIEEAAMLHDIGIFLTDAPSLGCRGPHPYLRHGHLGGKIMKKRGLMRHALVCERHVGAGIARQDILEQGLPLPARDMLPVTLEEIIVCYADKFFSKNDGTPPGEKTLAQVLAGLHAHGGQQADRFLSWHEKFS